MSIKSTIRDLKYFLATSAPYSVYSGYFKTKTRNIKRFKADRDEFRSYIKGLNFSRDWFSANIPQWKAAFEKHLSLEKPLKALEIGSWEGMSSCYILKSLPFALLTCVDTWEGADEHKGEDVLNDIEKNFDINTQRFGNRVVKYKGTSLGFFATCRAKEQFDLIYVDGSHHCHDVLIDTTKGFEQVKIGGLMIFDDYLWRFYDRKKDNPAAAINAFLKLKSGCYEIVSVYYQLILVKRSR